MEEEQHLPSHSQAEIAHLSDDEVRERLELLHKWGREMDDQIATLKDHRERLAISVRLLQNRLDRSVVMNLLSKKCS